MKKKYKNSKYKIVFKWILIPIALLLFWFCASLLFSTEKGFSVLQYSHTKDENNVFKEKRLFKGEKITGQFVAKENNLGIVSIRFGIVPDVEFNKLDKLVFRIKEKGKSNWQYENKYRSNLARSNRYLTLGFIPIPDSKGKLYQFELISLNGNNQNAIEISSKNPIYLSLYKFTKDEVLKDNESILRFSLNMIGAFFSNTDSLLSSSLFLLPFVFYMTWILIVQDYVEEKYPKNGNLFKFFINKMLRLFYKKRKGIFSILVILLLFYDAILFQEEISGLILGFLGLWIIVIYINKLSNITTFKIAFLFIVMSIMSIYFLNSLSVNKLSIYAYLLLLIGCIQILVSYKRKHLNR